MRGLRLASSAFALGVLLLASGCSTLPANDDRTASYALPDDGTTVLDRVAAASAPVATAPVSATNTPTDVVPPPSSGFQLIGAGSQAFGTLATLIANAKRSLDLQYYIVQDDPYARALLRAVREAAERGVRVRILIDDLYTTGKDDRIAWYSAHPNIEVRVFNPFTNGRPWLLTRLASSVTDLGRINHRMHNKVLIADNAFAVTGGRNIGAEYYTRSEKTNFVDIDVLVAGPVTKDLSAAFDRYWNSRYAYPIETLIGKQAPAETVDSRALADPNDPVLAAAAEARENGAPLQKEIDAGRVAMVVAPATLHVDRPSKVDHTAPKNLANGERAGATIASDVLTIIKRAQREVIIVSPYFVPGKQGVEVLREMMARGVKVRIVTNSLSATDATVVHIGYSHYRLPLLKLGAEIYEVRAEPGHERENLSTVGSSKASLHAKVIVVDRDAVFIGSFNADQRSTYENTEMGVEIASPALAEQVIERLRSRGEEGRYHVMLDGDGKLVWTTKDGDTERVYHDEPEVGPALKLTLELLAPFAPEVML